ncbi:MAG: hypothetical protein R6V40_04380 [Candidatus Moraniibacteriota bacterium]
MPKHIFIIRKKSFLRGNFLCVFFVSSFLLFASNNVLADAWWGEGFRDENWVLKHGGSLIYYQIKGKADPEKYKVRMYLLGSSGAGGHASDEAEAGDIIEMEEGGGEGVFDDAINNQYKIIVFKGGEDLISKKVSALPGKIIRLHFDVEKDIVSHSVETAYNPRQINLIPESSKYISATQLDKREPVFEDSFQREAVIEKGGKVNFQATDNETGLNYYKIKILDKNEAVVQDWKRQEKRFFIFSDEEEYEESSYVVQVRAYDYAGNYAEEKIDVEIKKAEEEKNNKDVEKNSQSNINSEKSENKEEASSRLNKKNQKEQKGLENDLIHFIKNIGWQIKNIWSNFLVAVLGFD